MATRTISNTGGNWNSTATWVEGVVPVLGDAVVATATSGQLTVNITTAACTSIDFTNYTNTFTISSGQQLAVSGTVKFVAGMTSAGTGTLRVLATSTLTSGGITFAGTLSLGGTSQTYTLGDDWIVSGGLIFSGTTAVSLTGAFNMSVAGGLTMTTTSTGTVSATIILNGTGTWSGTAALRNNLTINTAGTITVSGNVRYDTGTLTYTAGTVTTTGSTLIVSTTATLNTNGISWNNVTLSGNGTNITLTSDMLVTKLLTLGTSTAAFNINGAFTITCDNSAGSGGITFSGTTSQTNGTASIKMTGGTYTGVSSCRLGLNLELDGNITISSAAAMIYQAGTLKYTSGTITVTGTTLSLFNGGTLDTSGMTWNNVSFIGTSQTYNLSSDLNLLGNLSLSGGTTTTINGLFNINVGGNLTVTTTATNSGTASIVLNGTGTWSHSAAGVIRNNLTINTAGTITVSGTVYYNTGTLTYTAGTVNTTGSTLSIVTSTTLSTGTLAWNNISLTGTNTTTLLSNLNTTNLTAGSGTISFTLNSNNLLISNTLTIGITATTFNTPQDLQVTNLTLGSASASNCIINGIFTISVSGNLTHNNSTVSSTGTTSILLNGTGTWSHVSTGAIANNLTINTAGTITVSGTVYYNTGTLTYTAGTVTTTGSALVLGGGTVNTNGITWNNVSSPGGTITLTSDLTLLGSLTCYSTNVIINGVGRTVIVGGNLTLSLLNQTVSGTASIVLNGTGTWSNASGASLRNNLTINTSGTITVSGTVVYNTGTLTYTAGTVTTTGSTLALTGSTTLATNGINWNNISVSVSSTLTLTNNLTTTNFGVGGTAIVVSFNAGINTLSITDTLTITYATFNLPNDLQVTNLTIGTGVNTIPILNSYTISISGNLTTGTNQYGITGTTSLILNGTGTWSNTSSLGPIQLNLTINTSGTITISGSVHFSNATLTYTAGTVITTGSTLALRSAGISGFANWNATLNTDGIVWNDIVLGDGNSASVSITLSSNLNCLGQLYFLGGNYTFAGTYNILVGTLRIYPGYIASITIALSGNIISSGLVTLGNNSGNGTVQTINGSNFTIEAQNGITMVGPPSTVATVLGTAKIKITNGTITGANNVTLRNNLEIAGNVTLSDAAAFNYAFGTITYTSGTVTTKNSTLNLTGATTLINCHRIPFNIVTITSGITITMNEFFTGTPAVKTTIQPSSTTNYTITFQDSFEKFARNVKVSRATLSRPNQLTVITDKGNKGNNVGIKFYSNQMPNGFAKNNPATPTQTTYLPGGLVTDPCFV